MPNLFAPLETISRHVLGLTQEVQSGIQHIRLNLKIIFPGRYEISSCFSNGKISVFAGFSGKSVFEDSLNHDRFFRRSFENLSIHDTMLSCFRLSPRLFSAWMEDSPSFNEKFLRLLDRKNMIFTIQAYAGKVLCAAPSDIKPLMEGLAADPAKAASAS